MSKRHGVRSGASNLPDIGDQTVPQRRFVMMQLRVSVLRFPVSSSFVPRLTRVFTQGPTVIAAASNFEERHASTGFADDIASASAQRDWLSLDAAEMPGADPSAQSIAGWVRSFLMRPHGELGRAGHVCPFTAQAARFALLRIGVSGATDQAAIVATMREALQVFDDLPCRPSTRIFRTVIVAFPACTGPEGIATLRAVQNRLRHHSIVFGKMIGLFEPDSRAEGLINPAFRPLRAPVPTLAIRMLVEQDAPFVRRNPLLLPVYLAKFPLAGLRRLTGRAPAPAAQTRPASGRSAN